MSITSLTVVHPMQITPAMLVDCNVPEDEYPQWSASATYAKGARVIVLEQHKVYQSVADANTGNDPTAVLAEPKWLLVGATNRWKAFDKSVSSQSAQASTISYRIKPGRAVTNLGALNLKGGTSMRLRLVDPVYGEVYDKTISLSRIPVAVGWWAWFFGERTTPTQALFSGLPSFPGSELVIEITGTAELAVGVIVIGQERHFSLGVRMGARVGIQDYSRKERNEFGDVMVVERNFAKRASFSMLLLAREVDAFYDFLATVRATPCLWIGSNRYESTTVYGFYKSFDIVISYFDYSDCELELEGLT